MMMSQSNSSTQSSHRTRQTVITVTLFVLLTIAYSISLVSVYNKLNSRITTLTTTTNQFDNEHDIQDHNITVQLNNMTDVSHEIANLKASLLSQSNELTKLKKTVIFELNTTVKELNHTVKEVQKNIEQQVQEVSDNVSSQNSLMAYQFAGTFAILGSLISFWHMMSHIRKLNEPMIQRKLIAILWMVPIYSISAWLSLVFTSAETYLSLIKDIYEAYIIYTFLSFLIAVLARGNRNAVIDLLAQHADQLKPPIKFAFWKKKQVFASPRHKAEAVLDQCQILCMQFVFLRPFTSLITIICDAIHESSWDYRYPQFYIMWIVNISIFFAFTGLLRFYHVVKNDLNWINPFAKFLCIKGIVFLTFWQGIVISFIANAVYAQTSELGQFDALEWSKEAQSFLICLEMFMFAIAHCFIFPTDEWEPGYREREKKRIKAQFGDNLALRDFVKDVKLVMRKKKSQNPKKKYSRVNNGSPMKSEYDLENQSDEELDVDWKQGWSRIEQYIDIVESTSGSSQDNQNDLHLTVDTVDKKNEDGDDSDHVFA